MISQPRSLATISPKRVPTTKSATVTRDQLCCTVLTHDPLSKRDADRTAPVLAALGDPVRLRLLSIVAAEGEVCSCNLEGPLGKSQPTISHHTRVLSEAGLIVGEKRGRCASKTGRARLIYGTRRSGADGERSTVRRRSLRAHRGNPRCTIQESRFPIETTPVS